MRVIDLHELEGGNAEADRADSPSSSVELQPIWPQPCKWQSVNIPLPTLAHSSACCYCLPLVLLHERANSIKTLDVQESPRDLDSSHLRDEQAEQHGMHSCGSIKLRFGRATQFTSFISLQSSRTARAGPSKARLFPKATTLCAWQGLAARLHCSLKIPLYYCI
jgi:hypothetical protein